MTELLDTNVIDRAWEGLGTEAKAFGRRHARKLATFLGQGTLFELDGLREHFLRQEKQDHPKKLIVRAEVMEDFRYRAGIAASLIDEAEVRRADWSTMWDRVIDSTAGSKCYDLATRSYTISEKKAAAIFASDYEWTAGARLMGDKLIEFLTEGDD